MANILILNGPNLNLVGTREPLQYGHETLDALNAKLEAKALDLQHRLFFFQSNAEHLLIERIHAAQDQSIDFIIFNPAALTHTSIALRDALLAVCIPFIEVHLSNIYRREPFRHRSYFSDIAMGSIVGLQGEGYLLALQYAHHYFTTKRSIVESWTCEKSEN